MSKYQWFSDGRLGLFIHFGAYSAAARHEWVQTYELLKDHEYRMYVDNFDPDLFDAEAVVLAAKRAGMTYVVLTTKHHDGFCLWDSALTDFTTAVTIGRDLTAEFVEAARKHDLRVGLYHSLLDWHHPDFTVDWHHPRRNDKDAHSLNENRDMARYREYLHGQVRELLTQYGQIDYLFFDFTYPESKDGWDGKSSVDWAGAELLELCKELQPNMLVNDRLGIPADFVTPEQYQPTAPIVVDGVPMVWEACQTTNGSWGYHRDNHDFKSSDLLIRMLVDSVSMDGNLLLNIGPNGRGEIDSRDSSILDDIGEWMRLHERSVRGAGHSAFTPPREGVYTQRGNKLYLHLFSWPLGFVHLPELAGKVSYVQLLNDASWLKSSVTDSSQQAELMTPAGQAEGTLTVHLPVKRPDVALPVVELTLAEE